MAELVFQNSNGNDVTTSLLVAEVFGKEHSKVLMPPILALLPTLIAETENKPLMK